MARSKHLSEYHLWFSEGLKPDWFALSKLLLSRKSKIELKTNLSKIFPHTGRRDTGLQLLTICLSPFLWTGTMFDFFQMSGKVPVLRQFW